MLATGTTHAGTTHDGTTQAWTTLATGGGTTSAAHDGTTPEDEATQAATSAGASANATETAAERGDSDDESSVTVFAAGIGGFALLVVLVSVCVWMKKRRATPPAGTSSVEAAQSPADAKASGVSAADSAASVGS